MTQPSMWKWKPKILFQRIRGAGWGVYVYQHADHNPVIVIQRYGGEWRVEFFKDYFYWRRMKKKYGDFR